MCVVLVALALAIVIKIGTGIVQYEEFFFVKYRVLPVRSHAHLSHLFHVYLIASTSLLSPALLRTPISNIQEQFRCNLSTNTRRWHQETERNGQESTICQEMLGIMLTWRTFKVSFSPLFEPPTPHPPPTRMNRLGMVLGFAWLFACIWKSNSFI